jgi:ABC-2 type transport system permease protein
MNVAHHITPLGKLKWLLKREYWENRGGFLWAPVIAGGVSLLLTLLAIVAGLFAARRAAANGDLHVNGVNVNGLDLSLLTSQLSPEDTAKLAEGINFTLLLSSGWPFIVLAFVVFFYCLGALYDDRRDRSVLFWKSLPVSDGMTVLSKALSALLVAPVIAVIASIVSMLCFLLLISAVVMAHGGNPVSLIWAHADVGALIGGHLSWIPVYALWALPTVGWLMFCSAWARSKPFLWAVLVPVFTGVIVSWFKFMHLFNADAGWFWGNIVARALLSAVPGVDLAYRDNLSGGQSLQSATEAFSASRQLELLAMPGLWVGVVVGIALLFAAVYLRRSRDEG